MDKSSNSGISSIKKDHLVSGWFIYKLVKSYISNILGVGSRKSKVISGFEIEIEVLSKNLFSIVFFLKNHSVLQFKALVDMVCYDTVGYKKRFCLVYSLLSIRYNTRLHLIISVGSLIKLVSVVSLFKGGFWCEREVFDFFGVYFIKNKDLRRILTDYGFKGYPLRKDFPLTGYIDTYYDDSQKRVCYRNLELSQEYRVFNYKNVW